MQWQWFNADEKQTKKGKDMKEKSERTKKSSFCIFLPQFFPFFIIANILSIQYTYSWRSSYFYLGRLSHFSFAMFFSRVQNACLTHRNKVASWVCCSNHRCWVAKDFSMRICWYEICKNDHESQNHFDSKSFPCWYCRWVRDCGLEISLIARKWNSVKN